MTRSNLQRAIDNLDKAMCDLHDNDLFNQAVNDAILILGVMPADIRAEFGISRSTLNNWILGISAPNIAARAPVYEYFLGRAHQLRDSNG
jgi:hypothetical protein